MSKKNDWRKEFKRALIDALIANGSPLSNTPSTFGWTSPDGAEKTRKVASTGVDYASTTWEEAQWNEFMGTFYEGDTRVFGIDARLVLTDGTVIKWRYEGTASDLILAVVSDTGD